MIKFKDLNFRDLKHDIDIIRCIPCWGQGEVITSAQDGLLLKGDACPFCGGSGINHHYEVKHTETIHGTKVFIITKVT